MNTQRAITYTQRMWVLCVCVVIDKTGDERNMNINVVQRSTQRSGELTAADGTLFL